MRLVWCVVMLCTAHLSRMREPQGGGLELLRGLGAFWDENEVRWHATWTHPCARSYDVNGPLLPPSEPSLPLLRIPNRSFFCLGSRLINFQSQKMTAAAKAMAERKTLGHLS